MTTRINRRGFLKTSTAVGIAASSGALLKPSRVLGANERLNIGVIGVGGRGAGDLAGVAGENIVALCDVDEGRLDAAAAKHAAAKKYVDYRKLLEQDDLDAVVVATPDHHHAPATVRALRRGLHVYCEKPLTHTVAEARLIAELTARMIQPEAQYRHQWRKGDIVLWDNRCTWHIAAGDYPPEEERIHWRVSISER